MAQLGNDPEQLDQLSKKFEQEAQQIQQATQQISSQVNSVWWKGPDADRFRNELTWLEICCVACWICCASCSNFFDS